MWETRYMISDASKIIDVEPHVLRYWQDELALEIPRNEMGHRHYRQEDIDLLKSIKALKDKGFQLKAIKLLLPNIHKVEALDIERLFDLRDKLDIAMGLVGIKETDIGRAYGEVELGQVVNQGIEESDKRDDKNAHQDRGEEFKLEEDCKTKKTEVELGYALKNESEGDTLGTVESKNDQELLVKAEDKVIPTLKSISEGSINGQKGKGKSKLLINERSGYIVEDIVEQNQEKVVQIYNKTTAVQQRLKELDEKQEEQKVMNKTIQDNNLADDVQEDKNLENETFTGDNEKREDEIEKESNPKSREETEIMYKHNNNSMGAIHPDKLNDFRQIMIGIMVDVMNENSEPITKKMADTISTSVIKELDYHMRVREEREEERFKQLDRTIREYQHQRQQVAAARESKERKTESKFFKKHKKRI